MEIFCNCMQPNYDQIVSYGPKWWTEYREMDANYRFAGWTLDLMAYWLEKIIQNQFPAIADENTIRILERILGIEYDPDATLEERRKIVAIYYSGTGKLSKSVIQSTVKFYTGCDCDIFWDGTVFRIDVLGEKGPQFINDKILKFIRRRMPAHISYSVSAEEETKQIERIGLAHVLVPNMVIQCEQLNYTQAVEYVGISHVVVPNIILV